MPKYVIYSLDNDYVLCSRPVIYRPWPPTPVKNLSDLVPQEVENSDGKLGLDKRENRRDNAANGGTK